MKKIAIIGLGLIGGSLGLAIKENKLAEKVIGIPRREVTIEEALVKQAIDEGTLNLEKVAEADLIFICTPINLILSKLKEIAPHLKRGAVVTDVASTKSKIVKAAEKIIPGGVFFVGGHPMAGKETTGLNVAEGGLFKGKPYILTPTGKTGKKALKILEDLVSSIGGKIMTMDPKTHDLVAAGVSHLPVAVAAALINAVSKNTGIASQVKECASSGFRDTTRVASGDPVMGKDIFISNRKQVLALIKEFRASLKELESLVKQEKAEQILGWLKKSKDFRDQLFPPD